MHIEVQLLIYIQPKVLAVLLNLTQILPGNIKPWIVISLRTEGYGHTFVADFQEIF